MANYCDIHKIYLFSLYPNICPLGLDIWCIYVYLFSIYLTICIAELVDCAGLWAENIFICIVYTWFLNILNIYIYIYMFIAKVDSVQYLNIYGYC